MKGYSLGGIGVDEGIIFKIFKKCGGNGLGSPGSGYVPVADT
jgi:hypothetical protein